MANTLLPAYLRALPPAVTGAELARTEARRKAGRP